MKPINVVLSSRQDREFFGIVRMIDSRRSLGKIFLDDGKESPVMRFPETYEDGDRIFAVFPEDNRDEPPITFHVQNEEWNFGTVINLQPNGNGAILVNWPILRGLVMFKGHGFQARQHMPVRFRLHKNRNGELAVSDLGQAPEDMKHFARTPFCGRLTRGGQPWQSGFVKAIINRPNDSNGWFGFIEQPGVPGSVYFSGNLFENAYGRKGMRGDVVFFKSIQRYKDKGPAVQLFNPSGDDENNSTWWMETRDFWGKQHVIRCPENTFSNFLEPSPDMLYFVYATMADVAAETREVRIGRVPEAIALINNRVISDEMKLAAVDFLIDADLEHPAKFRASLMRERKIEILRQATSVLSASGKTEEALEREICLQCIDFQPERLKVYHHLISPLPLLESAETCSPREEEKTWEIMQNTPLPSSEEQGPESWGPMFESPSDSAPQIAPDGWFLDPDWMPFKSLHPADYLPIFDIELCQEEDI